MKAQFQTQWEECLQIISDNLHNEEAYNQFFAPIEALSFSDNKLELGVPSHFVVEQIEHEYLDLLRMTLRRVYGPKITLHYRTAIVKDGEIDVASVKAEIPEPRHETYLNPNCTFDTYFEGKSNELALTAAQTVSQKPGHNAFNPFFIFGASGVGKTHLAQAIGLKTLELFPQKRVLYITSHIFQVQYIDAVRRNQINDFINFYQSIDVLIVDDIQEFAGKGKVATQNTFFHIFNYLHQSGKQLIMTCDRPPVELEDLVPRLLTRFKWGFIGEIEHPDYDLRKEILKGKCAKEGLNIDSEVIDYIARNATDNVRDLEGIINSLLAHSIAFNRPIDKDLVSRVMRMIVKISTKVITCENIIQIVQNIFGIDNKTFNSKTRKREVVFARQAAMHLCKKHTSQSVSRIGMYVGGRDHATVLHALKSVDDLLATDSNFKEKYQEAEALLQE